jgi:hypothetical protein
MLPQTWLSRTIETLIANRVALDLAAAFSDVDPMDELRRLERLQQSWAKQNLGRARSSRSGKDGRSRGAASAPMTSHVLKDFEPQTWLHSDDFDRLQEAGDVKLEIHHRRQVSELLRFYEVLRHARAVRRPPMSSSGVHELEMRLGKSVDMIKANWDQWAKVAKDADVTLEEEVWRLERLRQFCQRLRRELDHPGRPSKDPILPGLLFGLETIFIFAGGTARGIAHNELNKREGPFLDFMFEAMNHLPNDLRPRSKQALGSMWEYMYQRRNKGEKYNKIFDIWWSRCIDINEMRLHRMASGGLTK